MKEFDQFLGFRSLVDFKTGPWYFNNVNQAELYGAVAPLIESLN